MAEFALPANFQNAEPYTESVAVVDDIVFGFGSFLTFYRTPGNDWYRVRFVNAFGQTSGTVGTLSVALAAASTPSSPTPWFQGVIFVAPALPPIPFNESWNFTWSADIGDNYSGRNTNFDNVGVFGMPLVYIPQNCIMQLQFTQSAGGDAESNVQGGIMQLEVVPVPGKAGSGARANADLYLLPALG